MTSRDNSQRNGNGIVQSVIERIERGHYYMALYESDRLIRKGVNRTIINYHCYPIVGRLWYKSREQARRLAKVFKNYYWDCWINSFENEERKTIKAQKVKR